MKIDEIKLNLDDQLAPIMKKVWEYEIDQYDLKTPIDVFNFVNANFNLNKLAEEHCYIIAFSSSLQPLAVFLISIGTVNAALVSPRSIFIRLLLCGATNFTVVHNHPSGKTKPSQADIDSCTRLKEAGKLIGLFLIDYIIIGNNCYSFFEEGLLNR